MISVVMVKMMMFVLSIMMIWRRLQRSWWSGVDDEPWGCWLNYDDDHNSNLLFDYQLWIKLMKTQAFSYKLDKPPTILFRWIKPPKPSSSDIIDSIVYIWNVLIFPQSNSLKKSKWYYCRHEDGPIAQSNSGEMIVFPGATLHMECLSLKVILDDNNSMMTMMIILDKIILEALCILESLSLKVIVIWWQCQWWR